MRKEGPAVPAPANPRARAGWMGLLSWLAAVSAQGAASQSIAPPAANLAQGQAVTLLGGAGDPATVTDARLAPEGTLARDSGVVLPDARSAVLIDLGTPRPLGALLVQADAADVYYVEASADASAWALVWRIEPMHGVAGLRTRTTVLPRPITTRFIRIRATTSRAVAVSEVQVFAAEPPSWPSLDTSLPESALPLWPGLTRETITTVYHGLSVLLMLVAGWSLLASRHAPTATEQRLRRGALVALGAASLLSWPNLLNFHYYGAAHKWEFFHYYLGGKYLPELGYSRLYLCAATVDAEDGLDLSGRVMRDLRDNRLLPVPVALERSAECRARFSPNRWEQFRHDARFFRNAMGPQQWEGVRNDHGFNGTPAWALLGGRLARLGPASPTQVTLLALLDGALLLGAFVLIGRAYGLESAALAAGYFGVNTLAPFGWTGGGFLRYDWLFWLVAGVVALRAARPALAGFALGYAALLRVFPLCAIAGVALKALAEVVAARSLRPLRDQRRFFAGAAGAAIFFVTASSLAMGRPGIWAEFARNSAKHVAGEATNSMGLRSFLSHEHSARLEVMRDPLLADPHERWTAHRSALERDMRPAVWAASVAFALLLALAVKGAPEWVAAVLGLGLLPVALTLSSYYYSALIAYATLWPVSPGAVFGLTAFGWVTNLIPGLWASRDDQYAWLSFALVVFTTGVTAAFAWRGRRRRGFEPLDPPAMMAAADRDERPA